MEFQTHTRIPSIDIKETVGDFIFGMLLEADDQDDPVLGAIQGSRWWFSGRHRFCPEGKELDALIDFANLRTDDTGQAMSFLKAYGLFQYQDCVLSADLPEIKEYWKRIEQSKRVPFATDLSTFWFHQKRFANLVNLSRPDIRNYEPAMMGLAHQINPELKKPKASSSHRFAGDLIVAATSYGLGQAKLGIIGDKKTFLPVITTVDVCSTLYVELLKQFVRGARLKECANEGCRRVFFQTRPDRKFCSACQNFCKIKRYRERMTR